jgi:ABC transporter with metal-binding/Fe-S-binding domain ATP-binding protein
MKLAVLFSGGKDSTYALYKTMTQGHKVKYLITMSPEREDSWMFHYPCIELTKLQAEALGIKQIIGKTKGEKEKELEDLKRVLEKIKTKIDGIVSGAIASNYQKSRIDKICKELNLKNISPLWQKDPLNLLKEMIANGFEIMITGVAAEGLDESWLGRKIDEKCISELVELNKRYGIHLTFEGGEGETFVLFCPIFSKRIEILDTIKHWDNKTQSGWLEIKKFRLVSI